MYENYSSFFFNIIRFRLAWMDLYSCGCFGTSGNAAYAINPLCFLAEGRRFWRSLFCCFIYLLFCLESGKKQQMNATVFTH